MALNKNFPTSPYQILDPEIRWYPGDKEFEDRAAQLVPPLVWTLRREVKKWRDNNYEGASKTSKYLLNFWFNTEHWQPKSDGTVQQFQFYFAQREAIETIIYLYEVANARDKHDLIRFSSRQDIQPDMFDEDWTRYVVKMATGSGKTKILALTLVWSYFHKLYEDGSDLSRNFLVIAPNVIVFERIKSDFQGLKVFWDDPMIPDDGFMDHNWREDFSKVRLHLQDDVKITNPVGNIFLSNIHRVFDNVNHNASVDDLNTMEYFLGPKPVTKTNDSKMDLGQIIREIDELVILNDEAHHIHDQKLAWFKSIEDIHNRLVQKGGKLPLQIDVTATPKKSNGAIFVQTVCDYPLVEAIHQNVVKHPVLPDEASRAKIKEQTAGKFVERYKEFLDLGYLEWKKVYDEQIKNGKKAILFVMTDDTTNADDVAEYYQTTFPALSGDSTMTIHTNRSGDITEATSGKSLEELKKLREQVNKVDSLESPVKVIVSVLMLKEGWDVQNVTTIVGLRAYSSKSKILPEQTLGRGLRRMYRGTDIKESVSVIGTDAFIEFVEQIKSEGVTLEYSKMGKGTEPKAPPVITIDNEDPNKDIEKLDIDLPLLTPRITREYKNFSDLNLKDFPFNPQPIREYTEQEKKEIIFVDIASEMISHATELENITPDATRAISFFTGRIMTDLRLKNTGGYDVLYLKVKDYIQNYLFGHKVDINDTNILKNLSDSHIRSLILDTFKDAINKLTVTDRGEAEIISTIKVSNTRSFVVQQQEIMVPKKSVFNKIIGDSGFELKFAAFLDNCDDVVSFAKNYMGIGFRLDYQNSKGEIANYYPDFLVKTSSVDRWVIETKGQEDVDVQPKRNRLKQWVEDVNSQQSKLKVHELFVTEQKFYEYRPKSFDELVKLFKIRDN
jgi:type III restriction enzyme